MNASNNDYWVDSGGAGRWWSRAVRSQAAHAAELEDVAPAREHARQSHAKGDDHEECEPQCQCLADPRGPFHCFPNGFRSKVN